MPCLLETDSVAVDLGFVRPPVPLGEVSSLHPVRLFYHQVVPPQEANLSKAPNLPLSLYFMGVLVFEISVALSAHLRNPGAFGALAEGQGLAVVEVIAKTAEVILSASCAGAVVCVHAKAKTNPPFPTDRPTHPDHSLTQSDGSMYNWCAFARVHAKALFGTELRNDGMNGRIRATRWMRRRSLKLLLVGEGRVSGAEFVGRCG
jgi:hypothetical protein